MIFGFCFCYYLLLITANIGSVNNTVINAVKNVNNIELITTAVKTVKTVVITTITKHNLINTFSSFLIINCIVLIISELKLQGQAKTLTLNELALFLLYILRPFML